ncbi:cytochrome P450 monooxygenase 9 [Dissophora globulifera]|nr:cytochrome P450 monooxygenase 9 [Dissophora globulifera]
MTDLNIPDDYLPIVDGQLWKKILREGTGESPMRKAKVNVHYVGTLFSNGDKFDSSRDRGSPFNFEIGVGQVIKGWDEGVKTMKIGELAELVCAPDYAYGAGGSPPKIPGNSTLKFEVELLGFQESADNPTAKLALAQKKKDQGNAFFKSGNNSSAAQAYKDGADLLSDMGGATEQQLQESGPLEPDHVKVTYRLAQAYLGLSEFEDAKKTALHGLEIAPADATFNSLLSVINAKQLAFKKKEKAAYSKMFS